MRDRIVLFVDGREIQPPTVTYEAPAAATEPDGTPTPGHYRMHGRVPPDARMLRWFYGIVADPYPLTIARADGQIYTEWIGGTVWSRPIDLTGQFTPPTRLEVIAQYLGLGYTHILPKGLDHILFVIGSVPAERAAEAGTDAGDGLHRRALDHAGPVDLRRVSLPPRSSSR